MNYLLVMPKNLGSTEHSNGFSIGLAYVSACLKKSGFNVFTANLDYLEGNTFYCLKKLITDCDIDVICTGGLSRDYSKLKEVIDTARTIHPSVIVVVGGGIISSDPQVSMKALKADIGVIGEGEITICELARALDNEQTYKDIPGLIYPDGNDGFIITQKRNEISDIDNIPFPDFDGFNYGQWVQRASGKGLIYTDRSCPFRCTFCFHPTGEKYRQRSLDSIFKEIDFQIEHYQIKEISMTGELFATTKKRVVDFCSRIKNYNIPWGISLRVCDAEAEMLELMKASGCISIVYGLESADNSVLKSMRKGITVEQIERALELTYEAGIMIQGNFIFGDINEDEHTVAQTLNFWQQHKDMHYLNLAMISVFPGSFLYDHACKTGIIKNPEQFLRDGCPFINVSKLTDAQYSELRAKIFELRLHPNVPARSVKIDSVNVNDECDVEYICRKCGVVTKLKSPFWFGQETRCPSCSLINFIDPFQYAVHRQDAFANMLPTNCVTVLWGAGGIYYKLMQKYKLFDLDRFVLVDMNSYCHGMAICGKEVFSPDIITQMNVKTVIITALSRKNDIYENLLSEYPSVEQVFIPAFDVTCEGIVPILKRM